MNEKPESEEFDEDEEEAAFEATLGGGLRSPCEGSGCRQEAWPEAGDPAGARLERRSEEKITAELTSDFDDYNIDDDSTAVRKMNASKDLDG